MLQGEKVVKEVGNVCTWRQLVGSVGQRWSQRLEPPFLRRGWVQEPGAPSVLPGLSVNVSSGFLLSLAGCNLQGPKSSRGEDNGPGGAGREQS